MEEKTQSTCLTGGDVDSGLLFRGRAQIGHSVHHLYAEGVVGVGQQVRDQHFRIERPNCLGTKWTLLLQGLHVLPSLAHFLQWTL